MPMNPAFPSLFDLQAPRKQGTISGFLGIGSFDPGDPHHAAALQQVQQGIMTGAYGDDEINAFVQKNPNVAPLVAQTVQKRNIFNKYFRPQQDAVIGQDDLGDKFAGEQPPSAPEAFQVASPAVNDVQGAVTALRSVGAVKEADELLKRQQESTPLKGITSLMVAARAEGRTTGNAWLDSQPPLVAQNMLARTTPPTSVQTGAGTLLYSRGQVPESRQPVPGFIPKVERTPPTVKTALATNESKLDKIKDVLIATDPNATKEQIAYLAKRGIQHDPQATGIKGILPNQILNRIDPNGVAVRGLIADLGSMEIRDRSGAAVTAAEFPRLAPFIPNEKDPPDVMRKKLRGFLNAVQQLNKDIRAGYTFEQGFIPPPTGRRGSHAKDESPPQPQSPSIPKGWNVRVK